MGRGVGGGGKPISRSDDDEWFIRRIEEAERYREREREKERADESGRRGEERRGGTRGGERQRERAPAREGERGRESAGGGGGDTDSKESFENDFAQELRPKMTGFRLASQIPGEIRFVIAHCLYICMHVYIYISLYK